MNQYEEKQWQARQHRHQVVDDWKESAQAIKETAESYQMKMLRREARREALTMMEDAARTVEDFEKVIIIWDKLERTERERIADHETMRTKGLLDWKLTGNETIIPQPLDRTYFKQILRGNFIDAIHDCPHELHEMTSCRLTYEMITELDENRKEILYYLAIRQWSPQRIATMRGQTDRNVRKVYTKMIDEMQYELFYYLYRRYKYLKIAIDDEGNEVTKRLFLPRHQKRLVIRNIALYNEDKKKLIDDIDLELNEEDIDYAKRMIAEEEAYLKKKKAASKKKRPEVNT